MIEKEFFSLSLVASLLSMRPLDLNPYGTGLFQKYSLRLNTMLTYN